MLGLKTNKQRGRQAVLLGQWAQDSPLAAFAKVKLYFMSN